MDEHVQYFHVITPHYGKKMPAGLTFRITEPNFDDMTVRVQMARCSASDVFSRKVGRTIAEKKQGILVPVEGLHTLIEDVTKAEYGGYLPHRGESTVKAASHYVITALQGMVMGCRDALGIPLPRTE